ncbi:membrane-bound lytic murein transglycosylase D [Leeuwenhoekiella aestuarii]|uniref:Membrane-bound lytic murein transglycosylase D n=1 Tax=Leeuwenhoekiella aestuarii TaxID=2249426 RepID=A0A4Q0NZ03_9FLAO|nr:lytic transglycosylase domain-containing protein [Leeuwenhoekiella aestuarii]RXG17931.1 membrane-bound lytic murein transglycosylase D [Leeuwenhoekiella aestuarii]RXG19260.1 membrane-bound lytic murein transglycosylase D [Leeuwenhoekiella aestuarii]
MKKRYRLGCALMFMTAVGLNAQKKSSNLETYEVSRTLPVVDTIELKEKLLLREQEIARSNTARKKQPFLYKEVEWDSTLQNLNDRKYAAKIDRLWMEELTNGSLYDSITALVDDTEYEDVDYPELTTKVLKERLAELDARTPFNVEYNPSLENVIKGYLKRHKPTLERLMGLSQFYFPGFEETLDKHNMPLELKYLAIVESALRPRAKSRVGATGMWQFMFNTGKLYGLDVSSYVDERMDPILSTEAAAQYLSKLYEIFDDWDLALASYNSGPGNVSKAIRRSGGRTNYWNIRHHLPRETAGYIPAFLATMYIFEYADEHGYHPAQPDVNYFETDTIRVKETITLQQVSAYTGVSLDEIQFLNPAYKLDVIPYLEDKKYYLRLPITAIGPFVANEENIYNTAKKELERDEKTLPQYLEVPSSVTYRVRSGDYLGKIASRYGVGVSQIKRWNNLRSNNLRIGQRLSLYPNQPVATSSSKASSKSVTSSGEKKYVVQRGDSLWKIARKFPGVSAENLKVWNDISGTKLKPGMTLVIAN